MKPNKPQEQATANPDAEVDLAAWIFSGDAAHIDAFILAGSSGIQSADLRAITKESQFVYEKVDAAKEAGLSDLKAHSRVIMQTLEFAARSHALDPLPAYLAEGNVCRSIPAQGARFNSRSGPGHRTN